MNTRGNELWNRLAILLQPLQQTLRGRSQPVSPPAKSEFQNQKAFGVRVSLYLMVPLLVLGAYVGGTQWGAVMFLSGLVIIPAITLPISVAHTYLLRLVGFRGPLISTAAGLLLGTLLTVAIRQPDWTKAVAIYGGVYGLIIGLGNTALFAPGLIADDRPRTLEEQAKADGL